MKAPGWPGIEPRWTTSDKSGVGTSTTSASLVWFTLSHGILNEIYYPAISTVATRDLGLLVTGPGNFFSEEKRDTEHRIETLVAGVPAYRLVNQCSEGRYRITKIIITDATRDVVLQKIRFETLQGSLDDYRLYALVAPHLNNGGRGNSGWCARYNGIPMMFAEHENLALALSSSAGFERMSCGYVGTSDGWQDLSRHRGMQWSYSRADDGNIAMTGEIDPARCGGELVLALGFGRTHHQAGQKVRAALLEDFDHHTDLYIGGWEAFHSCCNDFGCPDRNGFDLYRVSTSVLKSHESKQFAGAIIASLSIPWGNTKGDHDIGGYHLVWPRDLVETAGGLLATGDVEGARRTLLYLMSTQAADGHWPQNMWLSGDSFWGGIQTDETAFFILLADALRRCNELGSLNPYTAVRKACEFLVRKGPATDQDRWEENPGYSCFTLAVEIAALLAAADFADQNGDRNVARYLRESADSWNTLIEVLTYATGTQLAEEVGVEGYYVRIAPPDFLPGDDLAQASIRIRNVPDCDAIKRAADVVSPDALALVRFGLRSASDPRIQNTIKVIDATLKTDTATGPGWHRYNHDGYGEHADGSAFDGIGIGRIWPLLAGERAHYELAADNHPAAERLLEVMVAQTSEGGMLPEQVWDADDVPNYELYNGHPSGSAMPLVWAHAECIKLIRSLADGRVFDMPPQPVHRYQEQKSSVKFAFWRFNFQRQSIPARTRLRLELLAPATIRWSCDDWVTVRESKTADTDLGVHFAELPTGRVAAGREVRFTFYWQEADRWEGRDFNVRIDR